MTSIEEKIQRLKDNDPTLKRLVLDCDEIGLVEAARITEALNLNTSLKILD